MDNTLNNNYDTTLWNGKNVYQIKPPSNLQQPMGTGIEITVPLYTGSNTDFTVLWVQTNSNVRINFRVYIKNSNDTYTTFGTYSAGMRSANLFSPDGTIHNEIHNLFEWYPVPIKLNSDRKILISNPTSIDTWYSGFAFSTNPWNHSRVSAYTVYYNLNQDGQDNSIITTYSTQSTIVNYKVNNIDFIWNNDSIVKFTPGTSNFRIPFVNSGKDKIFYIIDHNDNYGPSVVNVEINNTNVGNLYTTFDNPFSRHYNSKKYHRYNAVIIPKNLLQNLDNFITVSIIIPTNSADLWFKEVGTHDVNPFD